MAELRRDPVSGTWVVSGYSVTKAGTVGECPFCPGNESLTPKTITQFKDGDGEWLLRCFPASNPLFVIEREEDKRAEGLYDKMGNVGAHEIIVDNRSHTKTLSGFTEEEVFHLINLYIERLRDLKKDKRFKYIQVFKNHGELAGSFIFHPHSHVVAMPVIPQMIEMELMNARRHYGKKERCLFCDIIAQEIRQNKRVVTVNGSFTAICPFASRFPYEIWILPKFHDAVFEYLRDDPVKRDLASILLDIMKRLEKVTNAYSMVLHTSPNVMRAPSVEDDTHVGDYFHWHIEILPRDLRSSRYKREDQFYAISLTPEEATSSLKKQSI